MLSKTTMYLHGDKDYNRDIARELNLSKKAANYFSYALHEIAFEVEINHETGECDILKVNGRTLLP